ncbi:MAG: MFS transporter [Phycisphaeraceae bacterium]|nr:MFS transporter [Phycisphaeraceae bacterium]
MATSKRSHHSKAKHDPFAALRHPNYRLFAAGFVTSATGLQMMAMALAWEIYERASAENFLGPKGAALALGFIGLARALPVVIMALPAGYVIDSFDRKRVLFLTQSGFAIMAALLAFASFSTASLWLMFLLITLSGCVRSFNGPTRSSLLPDLVPEHDFPNAVTWNSGMFQVAAVAGPLIAGYIIYHVHHAWPVYAISAILCAVFALTTLGLRPISHHTAARGKMSLAGMLDGLSHLWKERTIFAAITLDLFAVLLGGATALLPIYASDILHVGAVGLGWLKAGPYIGAGVMALVLAWFPLIRRAGPAMLLSIAGFGFCTIIFGISTSFALSMTMLVLLGALDSISIVVRHVLVQLRTPRHLRGRVSAVNSVFIECSNELGAFESGLVARFFGPIISVVSGGLGTILVVAGVAWLIPEIRRLDKLHDKPIDLAEDAGK